MRSLLELVTLELVTLELVTNYQPLVADANISRFWRKGDRIHLCNCTLAAANLHVVAFALRNG